MAAKKSSASTGWTSIQVKSDTAALLRRLAVALIEQEDELPSLGRTVHIAAELLVKELKKQGVTIPKSVGRLPSGPRRKRAD